MRCVSSGGGRGRREGRSRGRSWRRDDALPATVDLRRYPALAPAVDRAAARAATQRLIEVTGASTVPVDVWIGKDDRVRRVTQKLSFTGVGGPSAIEQRFELYDFGTTVDIKIPPPSQVTDVTKLASSGAATVGP